LKKLIVTADDVGLHPGMTHGALAAADAGIVTAVSVAAVGRAFEPAVELLRDRPALDVGIHLTLVGERPLSPPEKIPSLVGRDGALLSGYPALARRFFLGGIAAREVEAELRRQIERLLASGLRLLHANAHQHLHVLPRVFEIVLRLAEEHKIPYVRIPCEPAVAGHWSPRTAQLAVLNALGRRARRRLEPAGRVAAVERTLGVVDAGHLTAERLRGALRLAAPGGVSELVCHPGLGDHELAAAYAWDYDWDSETAALCDPRVPYLLREEGIELTSFSRL
jgi:hopanoid biosynthesis associated protein HpnK